MGGAATTTLSERDSKALLADYGVSLLAEHTADDPPAAVRAADGIGYPVVVKLNGERIAHKTERGLVRLAVPDARGVEQAAAELLAAATPADGVVSLLVAPMVSSSRELICGLSTDAQFGPTILVGLGGVLAEAIADVAIRLAPITAADAAEMLDELRTAEVLGPFRGEPPVDRDELTSILIGLSSLADARPDVRAVDLNPVLVVDGHPVAVDALVELAS